MSGGLSLIRIRIEVPTVPAAGAACLFTIPTGRLYRLVEATATLTTVGAANREIRLEHLDAPGGNLLGRWFTGITQVAATTIQYTWSPGDTGHAGPQSPNGVIGIASPGVWFQGGEGFVITAQNLQAGDTITAIRCVFEEWR